MPGAVLPTNALVAAGVAEAEGAVKCDARLVGQGDPGEGPSIAEHSQPVEQLPIEGTSNALTLCA